MIYEKEALANISFPLGGIGTGCIGLLGNGELSDFEIFNRPNKNMRNGYTHIAVRARTSSGSDLRVLQGDTLEGYMGRPVRGANYAGFGFGPSNEAMPGFPHFRDVSFEGEMPIATLRFRDGGFPADVTLTAFNPLIPHREDDSGIPAAFFEVELCNTAGEEVEYTVALTVKNPSAVTRNTAFTEAGRTGIFLADAGHTADELGYADLTMLTDCPDAVAQEYWYRGTWMDGVTTYWKAMASDGRLAPRHYDEAGKGDHATLAAYVRVPAGERGRVRFVLAWSVPNAYNAYASDNARDADGHIPTWRNYYATCYPTSRESARDALVRFDSLLADSRTFAGALRASTVPDAVREAASATLAVLKSPTVLRLEGGELWGFEGTCETVGSCYGSCQHVWGYAYALPFLFPRLERSLRDVNVKYALHESGETAFRVSLPLGSASTTPHACVDGQMGEVIRCYREYKISGDLAWLRRMAPAVFSMLEYAWSEENPDGWDRDRDGILEGRQHHTLDMELYGPSSWLEGMYLLALDCAAEIAELVGEGERAQGYRALYKNGRRYLNEALYNGEYFCQRVALDDAALLGRYHGESYFNEESREIKYQIGEGCEIDQMLADFHAHLIGRPTLFDDDKKRTALGALYRYNHKPTMREVTNMWRIFALNDEAGTVICTYPEGARVPAIPIPYCEECMTGFEYALGGLMLAEGMEKEGEVIVKAVRDRYDGKKRNPWNEIECGSNYARAMSSFGILPILSGMRYDMSVPMLGFAPRRTGDGVYFFSVGEAYGTVEYRGRERILTVLGGVLPLAVFTTGDAAATALTIDGASIPFERVAGGVRFERSEIHKRLVLSI